MSAADPLNGAIPASWTFENAAVAGGFDDHVRAQLGFYDAASDLVVEIARERLPKAGVLVDLGSATGNIVRRLASHLRAVDGFAYAVEPSAEMAALFDGGAAPCELHEVPAEGFDQWTAGPHVVVSFLTLMFVPRRHRKQLVGRIMDNLADGGCLIVVEKEELGWPLAAPCRLARLNGKLGRGATKEAVLGKELALSGAQCAVQSDQLKEWLGGRLVREFFRWGEFYGLAAYKE